MRTRTIMAMGVLLVLATPSAAKEPLGIKDIGRLAKENPKKAVALFERLLGSARTGMDLGMQQALASAGHGLIPSRGTTPRPAALLPHLKKTGGAKSYVYFSAHKLAYTALLRATATGEYDGIKAAIDLASKRSSVKYGKYAKTMVAYAKGLQAAQAGKPEQAIASFTEVLAEASKQGWSHLSIHAGIELVLAHAGMGNAEAAESVLTDVLAGVRQDTNIPVLAPVARMAKTRFAEPCPKLGEAWAAAFKKRMEAYSASGAAGAGGAGRSPKQTELGKALAKWKKGKPLIEVKRVGNKFEVTYKFGALGAAEQKFAPGIKNLDKGGLVLAFWMSGVRLTFVSPMNEPVPGVNSAPGRWEIYDYLADGETWVLYATGETRFK